MTDETAKLAADAVVFRQDNENSPTEILLIRRKKAPFKGRWALPGYVDVGESPERACERELAEETSLLAPFEMNPWVPLPVRGEPFRDPRERVVTFPFAVLLSGPRAPVQGRDDAIEANWYPLKEVVDGDLAFDHAEIVGSAIRHFGPERLLK